MTRAELEAITEPYDPRNPAPHRAWQTIAATPGIIALLILLFIVWKPIFIVLRLLWG